MAQRQSRDDEDRQRDDERRNGRVEHVADMREDRHADGGRSEHRRIGEQRNLVAEIGPRNDRARDPPFGKAHRLPDTHQRHADRGDRRPRAAGHQRHAGADDARGDEKKRGVQDFQPVIDHRRHHAAHHPRSGDGADQQQDDDGRRRGAYVVDDRILKHRPLAAVDADREHHADRRGREQRDLASAVYRIAPETADDHI